MREFMYSSCHVYCDKMHAYALYEIQPFIVSVFNLVINEKLFLTNLPYCYQPLPVAAANWETMKATWLTVKTRTHVFNAHYVLLFNFPNDALNSLLSLWSQPLAVDQPFSTSKRLFTIKKVKIFTYTRKDRICNQSIL